MRINIRYVKESDIFDFVRYKTKFLIITVLYSLIIFGCITGVEAVEKTASDKEKRIKYVRSKHGLRALMALNKSQILISKFLKKETENYEKIKTAINNGQIKIGEDASFIRDEYGEPVIVLPEKKGSLTRWVYKPGGGSFFSKEKVYLVFDKDEKLARWKLPH